MKKVKIRVDYRINYTGDSGIFTILHLNARNLACMHAKSQVEKTSKKIVSQFDFLRVFTVFKHAFTYFKVHEKIIFAL